MLRKTYFDLPIPSPFSASHLCLSGSPTLDLQPQEGNFFVSKRGIPCKCQHHPSFSHLKERAGRRWDQAWAAQRWSFETWGNVGSPSMVATKGSLAGAMREESAGFKISLCLVWTYSKYKLNSNENFINFTLPKCAYVCFRRVMIKGKGSTAGERGAAVIQLNNYTLTTKVLRASGCSGSPLRGGIFTTDSLILCFNSTPIQECDWYTWAPGYSLSLSLYFLDPQLLQL